jgi:quercetin dioxygenase-like cupin family protein
MSFVDWSQIKTERVTPEVTRQVVHGENVTVARIHQAQGAVFPEHSHASEQVTLLLAGRVRLTYPDHDQIVEAGQLIQTPPNLPHRLDALEESFVIDIFAPRRDDWMRAI